jgi:tetratricopeptide (TPR) repeat protein
MHQVLNDAEQSNSYYREVLLLVERENLEVSRTRWWENMAFNSLSIGDNAEAHNFVDSALAILPAVEEVQTTKYENPLILEFLGIPIPIWNFGFLGSGSPMSAMGLGIEDELLLNYSMKQELHTQGKDIARAKEIAYLRLAIAVRRSDPEAESILWSEIGFLLWAEGNELDAERCFRRSLFLCDKHGLRSGKLSAMLNLGCLVLNREESYPTLLATYIAETTVFEDRFQ